MNTEQQSPQNLQLTLTVKMTAAQVVETSVTVNNNSPIQDYVHPDDHTQPTYEMTPGFKPFKTTFLSTTLLLGKRLIHKVVLNNSLTMFQTNRQKQQYESGPSLLSGIITSSMGWSCVTVEGPGALMRYGSTAKDPPSVKMVDGTL